MNLLIQLSLYKKLKKSLISLNILGLDWFSTVNNLTKLNVAEVYEKICENLN